jgi:hypothetical protein
MCQAPPLPVRACPKCGRTMDLKEWPFELLGQTRYRRVLACPDRRCPSMVPASTYRIEPDPTRPRGAHLHGLVMNRRTKKTRMPPPLDDERRRLAEEVGVPLVEWYVRCKLTRDDYRVVGGKEEALGLGFLLATLLAGSDISPEDYPLRLICKLTWTLHRGSMFAQSYRHRQRGVPTRAVSTSPEPGSDNDDPVGLIDRREPNPAQIAAANDLQEALARRLPQRSAEVLEMLAEGLDRGAIATRLHVTPCAVKGRHQLIAREARALLSGKPSSVPRVDRTSDRPSAPFEPTDLQERILAALDGKAMNATALARALGWQDKCALYAYHRDGEKFRYGDRGGLKELALRGLVRRHHVCGFFRPDAPPAELATCV